MVDDLHDAPILTPIEDVDWPTAAEHLRADFAGRLNVYRVMAHNPALLIAWERLRNHIVLSSALTPQQSEIVILRTGHRWGSSYEWKQHVVRGRLAGLSDDRIVAARRPSDALDAVVDDDILLIAAVDALLDDGRLAGRLLEDLTSRIGSPAVLDVIATVGMYTTLALLIETYCVPLDEDIAQQFSEPGAKS